MGPDSLRSIALYMYNSKDEKSHTTEMQVCLVCIERIYISLQRDDYVPIVVAVSILFYPITFGGRRGTTDEFATTPFHLDLVELAKSIPVHSLILSSHLFFCLPLFLFPFTVPCRIVFAKQEDLET